MTEQKTSNILEIKKKKATCKKKKKKQQKNEKTADDGPLQHTGLAKQTKMQ